MKGFEMKNLVQIDEYGALIDGGKTVEVLGVALPHFSSEKGRANSVLLMDAINTERETGKAPRQLAEENAKLRNVLYEIRDSGNIHDVTRLAIDALEG